MIRNEEELEDALSEPTEEVVAELSALSGDLVVLGAGGKMGPSLARMARRALARAGSERRVFAVSRFSDPAVRERLENAGVHTVAADLLDPQQVARLPRAAHVFYLVGHKFGAARAPWQAWAHNAWAPGLAAHHYREADFVVFSSGNVYPFVDVTSAGADENTPPAPRGEYAWSVLARERVFEHFSREHGTRVLLLRLNYAVELRYGVLVDLAARILRDEPIDLTTGHVNVLWQGDANAAALRCLKLAARPPAVCNVAGPEVASVRELALRLGKRLGRRPRFTGQEAPTALLSNAGRAWRRFGMPRFDPLTLCDLTADWLRAGGRTFDKPTRYEVRDGAF